MYRPLLIEGLTKGRSLDRGNATPSAIRSDFGRLGLTAIDIGACNTRWAGGGGNDSKELELFLRLRNALGHGNETELRALIASGDVKDSVSWARSRRPVLNRYAKALDRIVWDHLHQTTGSEPWP